MNTKKSSLPLLIVLLIFLFPVVCGSLLYHFADRFHFKTINHGILVQPPINIQEAQVSAKMSSPKKWRVIYVFSDCDASCKKMQFDLLQIQKILGKDRDRVEIITESKASTSLKKWQSVFEKQIAKDFNLADKIYLVDPIGNVFMYYPSTTNPMDILKDMQKVLEVSQIG
jgi:hypothetical protein